MYVEESEWINTMMEKGNLVSKTNKQTKKNPDWNQLTWLR